MVPIAEAPKEAAPNAGATENVSVWLVDDNDQLRTLVAEILGNHGGIICARHFSSPDALLSTLASKPGPDVILLDVQMGDRNGLDAVRPIKSLTRSTRVLMFTTCFNREWRERALGDGASDYLLKSDAMEKVAARIRCPANDPVPNLNARRRFRRATDCSVAVQSSQPGADKSRRLLSRTLERLRAFWN
ncbi:MAG TPA: response regulator [bacterium]|nr:response regulator [bacterium]